MVFRSNVQRTVHFQVFSFEISLWQNHLKNIVATENCCFVNRGFAFFIFDIYIGPGVDQQFDAFFIFTVSRQVKRCVAIVVLSVNSRPGIEKCFNDFLAVTQRGQVQRSLTFRIFGKNLFGVGGKVTQSTVDFISFNHRFHSILHLNFCGRRLNSWEFCSTA